MRALVLVGGAAVLFVGPLPATGHDHGGRGPAGALGHHGGPGAGDQGAAPSGSAVGIPGASGKGEDHGGGEGPGKGEHHGLPASDHHVALPPPPHVPEASPGRHLGHGVGVGGPHGGLGRGHGRHARQQESGVATGGGSGSGTSTGTGSGGSVGTAGPGRRQPQTPSAGATPHPGGAQPVGATPLPAPTGTATPTPGATPAPAPVGVPLPQLTPGLERALASGQALTGAGSPLAVAAARVIPTVVPRAAIGAVGSAARLITPAGRAALAAAGEGLRRSGAGRSPLRQASANILAAIPRGIWIALASLGFLSVMLVGTTTAATVASRRRGRALEQAAALGLVDSLTGLLTRGALEQRLAAELGRARRHQRPLSLVFFDVRGLKAVNDLHGHGAGDRLLKEVGALLVSSSRDHDVCGRIGGDECVVVLPEDDGAGAQAFRDRVYAALPQARANVGLRASWDLTSGVATFPEDGETPRELLHAADRRLYQHRGIEIDPPQSTAAD